MSRGAAMSTVPLNCIELSVGGGIRPAPRDDHAPAGVDPGTYAPGSLMNAVRQPIEQKA